MTVLCKLRAHLLTHNCYVVHNNKSICEDLFYAFVCTLFLSKLQTIKTLLAFISSQIIFDGDHLAKEQKIFFLSCCHLQ